jgi:hypothetical protein
MASGYLQNKKKCREPEKQQTCAKIEKEILRYVSEQHRSKSMLGNFQQTSTTCIYSERFISEKTPNIFPQNILPC